MTEKKLLTVYQAICATFCVIVVISNIISAKMVKLPYVEFGVPAGLVTYPLTFLLSDLVTEIFGPRKAKQMVYTALFMNLLGFAIVQLALILPSTNQEDQNTFQLVLGLSGLRIFSSVTAYLIGQIVDIQLYALIKKWTDSRFLWLRNNGATCLSQIVDTIIVDVLFLYLGLGMSWKEVFPIMVASYIYKAFFSIASTPIFYMCVSLIRSNEKTINSIQGMIYESKV